MTEGDDATSVLVPTSLRFLRQVRATHFDQLAQLIFKKFPGFGLIFCCF